MTSSIERKVKEWMASQESPVGSGTTGEISSNSKDLTGPMDKILQNDSGVSKSLSSPMEKVLQGDSSGSKASEDGGEKRPDQGSEIPHDATTPSSIIGTAIVGGREITFIKRNPDAPEPPPMTDEEIRDMIRNSKPMPMPVVVLPKQLEYPGDFHRQDEKPDPFFDPRFPADSNR